ncbi:MAG TPA: glycosyltransferase [Nitrososphaerales archaeon]|nr:glycosyltransferase [Nitrososphaerales archaeon]
MKIACLVWASFSDRMDELANAVSGERKNINFGYLPKYLAPLKYLAFFAATQAYLFSTRPDVVYAQNPPVFCPYACLPYCKLSGKKLMIDHHNVWSVKSFGQSVISQPLALLEKVAGMLAYANTVPHSVWKAALERFSAKRVLVVKDFVAANPFPRDEAVRRSISTSGLIGIASGHQGLPEERVEVEAMAAEAASGATLAITGPPERLASRINSLGPLSHVKYMGYLPKSEYDALKASCDFGLNISDEPYTVNHVLFEYAASSLPTISTRREVIESVFGDSLVYVEDSDAREVTERIKSFLVNPSLLSEYRNRMSRKFHELERSRAEELEALQLLITAK